MYSRLIYCLIFIISLLASEFKAQLHEIGGSLGIGQVEISDIQSNEHGLMNPFNIKDKQHLLASFDYYFTPKYAITRLKTGIEFNHRAIQEPYSHFTISSLTIPIGADFFFGKKFQFIVGGGVLNTFTLAADVTYKEFYEENKKNYSLLFEYNLGLGVKISSNKRLVLMYQKNSGIAGGVYNEVYYKHGPYSSSKTETPQVYYDSLILLKFIYSFKKQDEH